jgi:large subunit ribosomal protein L1
LAVLDINTESVTRAIEEAKKNSKKRNFAQGVDLTINLKDLDMAKPENRIDEELVLPFGTGKEIKIGVIADGELAMQSKNIADIIIGKNQLEEMGKKKKDAKRLASDIDYFVASVDLMPLVGKSIGPVLGPRGKMPKPVPPNAPVKAIIEKLKKTIKIKTKDQPVVKVLAGSEEMDIQKLAENIEAILTLMERKLEKGQDNMKSIYIKTTMGPSVKLGA